MEFSSYSKSQVMSSQSINGKTVTKGQVVEYVNGKQTMNKKFVKENDQPIRYINNIGQQSQQNNNQIQYMYNKPQQIEWSKKYKLTK